jgi:hypothetical protein
MTPFFASNASVSCKFIAAKKDVTSWPKTPANTGIFELTTAQKKSKILYHTSYILNQNTPISP